MPSRRSFLHASRTVLGLALASGWLLPAGAGAAEGPLAGAFAARSLADVIAALGLAGPPQESPALQLTAPEIAENGAVVPVTVSTTLPDVRRLAILIEHNPNTLAARFTLLPDALPVLSTRVKLAQTSDIYVLAETGSGLYFARQSVKVTLGGCGG